ncbi:MAG: hypothetical protein ABI634_14080 [Acidobacteriota bacterium]
MARPNIITRGTGLVGRLMVGLTNPILFFQGSGAPVDGTTGAGDANPGSEYTDRATGDVYKNIGTKASPVWLIASGGAQLRVATVALTNAQMLALRATPITLVAAPGAGKRLSLVGGTLNINATAGAYTESTANLAVRYVGASGVTVSQAIEATGFCDQAGKMHTDFLPKVDPIATEAQAVNQPFVLHNTGAGEWGGGNVANTGRVVIAYRVVPTL